METEKKTVKERLTEIREISAKETVKALQLAKELIVDAYGTKDDALIAESHFRLGYLQLYQRQYHDAYSDLNQAITLYEQIDQHMLMRAMGYLGNLYLELGEYTKALSTYEVTLEKLSDSSIQDIQLQISLLNNIGEVYRHLENFRTALEYYSEALEIHRENNLEYGAVYANLNTAHCYKCLSNPKRAFEYANKAFLLAQLEEEFIALPEIYGLLVDLFLEEGNQIEAKNMMKDALIFCEKVGETKESKNFYEKLIQLSLQAGQIKEAKEFLEGLQTFYGQNGLKEDSRLYRICANYYEKKGELSESLLAYKKSYEEKQREDAVSNQKEINLLMERYGIEQEENEREIERIKNGFLKEKNLELKEKSDVLNRILEQLSLLENVGQYITSTFDFEEIFTSVYLYLKDILKVDVFGVGTMKGDQNIISYDTYIEDNQRADNYYINMDDPKSLGAWAVKNNQAVKLNYAKKEYLQYIEELPQRLDSEKYPKEKELKSAIFCPLMLENKKIGLLTLQSYEEAAYGEDEFDIVKILGAYMAIALNNSIQNSILSKEIEERKSAQEKLKVLNAKLTKLSIVDELTGAYNRRYLTETISDEWYKASRTKSPLSLIILDVDKFKQYNDTYGHLQGDVCLKEVTKVLLKAAKRENDIVCRYGGDEFVILLPYTELEGARIIAEKMREEVEKLGIPHMTSDVSDVVTITLGVACVVPDFKQSHEVLLGIADEALYRAKSKSRNVVIAIETNTPTEENLF